MTDLTFQRQQAELVVACERNDPFAVRVLLQKGVLTKNHRIPQRGESTVLHCVASAGHEDIVRLLLAQPLIDPNHPGNWDWTPLMVACLYGRSGVVRDLLRHSRVDVNQRDAHQQTALWLACHRPMVRNDILEMLLASGRLDPCTIRLPNLPNPHFKSNGRMPLYMTERKDLLKEHWTRPRGSTRRLRRELRWTTPGAQLMVLTLLLDGQFIAFAMDMNLKGVMVSACCIL